MARALGYFSETDRGFEGVIATLTARAPVEIIANEAKEKASQPDYRIFGKTGVEIGAIWKRIAKSSGAEILSVTLSNPAFGPGRIYGNLVPTKTDSAKHVLLWNES